LTVFTRRVEGESVARPGRVNAVSPEHGKVDREDRGVEDVRGFSLARRMNENRRSESDRP
jgi:hypothetical protein